MSMIDKLSILGVRSFDNQQSATIQFLAPLTLIVGYNGAGKTTIIECLKYATTGDLPANSKTNGAFIHDPALCGEREVLAQVKLAFKSTSGARMVATRSLQLSVKKATRQQKTLEGILMMSRNGERTTVSSRVAELDHILPQYLGVPKAILEYVIFCHQEDSLWPLSTSNELKKRFDDIFDSTRYSKAIENIKILRKTTREKIEKQKQDVEHLKVEKDRGARAEKEMTTLSEDIDALRATLKEIEDDRKEAIAKADDAWDRHAQFAAVVGRLENKRQQAKSLESHVQDLRQHMTEMDDSDERLQEIIDQYEERMKQLQDESTEFITTYNELKGDMEASRKQMGIKQSEVGRYQAQKDTFERQIQSRAELIKDTARRHNVRGFDLEVTDEHVRDFMERISRMARDQNRAFEKARQESQEETQNAQRILNEIQNRKTGLTQNKESARSQMANNDKKIAVLQDDLNNIDVDEGSTAILESTIEDVERRLSRAKSDFEVTDWDSQIASSNAEVRQVEEQQAKLNNELVQGTKQVSESARLDFLHKEIKDRQKSLETMTGAHGSKICNAVGGDWTPGSLEHLYNDALEQKVSDVHDAENQRDGTSRELELIESKMAGLSADIQRKRKDANDAEKKVKEAIDAEAEDFPDALRDLEVNRNTVGKDANSASAMEGYYKDALQRSEEHGVCKLCMRSWKNDKEKTKFKTDLEKKIKSLVDQTIAQEYKEVQEDLERMKAVQGDYDGWVRLKQVELPALEKEREVLEMKRTTLLAEVDRRDTLVNECQSAKRDIEAMQKTVQNIVKSHAEVHTFKAQIDELQANQKSQGSSRGLEKIQEDLEKSNDHSRRVKDKLQQLTDDRSRAQGFINGLELEARDTRSKLNTASYQLKEKNALRKQVEELKSSSNEQREAIRRIDGDVQDLAPKIAQAQETYDEACRRGDQRVRELQQEANKISESFNELKLVDKEINAYVDRGGPQQLATSKREVDHLEEEIGKLEREQLRITQEINKIKEQLRNQDDTRRAINDNLRFRRGKRELSSVKTDIMELEAQDAEEDSNKWEREAQKWTDKRTQLAADYASAIGIMSTKSDQLAKYDREYNLTFANAAENFRKANIEYETHKQCANDLAVYGGALDKAIMKFHSLKMEEINRIIEELWKKTYQGTDVDTIVIRSDNETQKGNRSYNYRVCMVKADAEMDMRGRCSAGQKVLASIIIRLALAECFGVNCGIIALDEPTTNLDRDNIRALAESLAEIIKLRRKQANFQLIVITHDEEFLRMMGVSDFVDNYYRISRNAQLKSVIERQSIGEVMA